MNTKLLCVGDLHLGRVPSHLPENLEADWKFELRSARPTAVWRQIVEQACQLAVDAVLLAGDVVDRENRQYEALGPLHSGVTKLLENGIRVVGVVGNHDVDTLPRLADQIPGFELLGKGGQWEVCRVKDASLVGWSFPQAVVRENPMAEFNRVRDELRDAPGPVIGLLHCDLDQSGSRYAPVHSSDLLDPSVCAWLLGHVHTPAGLAEHNRPVGYLGSAVPLDPTETGRRGPWLCEIGDRHLRMRHLQSGPLRWERIEVDVTGLEDVSDLSGRLTEGLKALHRRLEPELEGARLVGGRVELRGITRVCRELRSELERLPLRDQVLLQDQTYYFIDRVVSRAKSPLPLPKVAEGTSYPALLAKRLLQLQDRDAEVEPFVQRAMARLQSNADRPPWSQAGDLVITPDVARDYLIRAGLDALEELLAQQKESYSALLAEQ